MKRAHSFDPTHVRTEDGRGRCKHCGLERRVVGVLAPDWNRIGSKVFPVAKCVRLYRVIGGVNWSTWLPRCGR